MKQDYLTPFLKKANLHIPLTLYLDNPLMSNKGLNDLPLVEPLEPLGPLEPLVEPLEPLGPLEPLVEGGGSIEKALAKMITDAIISGLKKSDKYVKDKEKRLGKIRADIKKIKIISMPNAINLYYGGGILVFGPNFNIQKMIHMFYNTDTKPVYFSKEIGDSMEDNVVNKNLTQSKKYTSANIIQEIKDVIK